LIWLKEREQAGIDIVTDGEQFRTHFVHGFREKIDGIDWNSIKANIDWKAGLGREWRQYEETFPALNASRIDQISLECANSYVPPAFMGLLKDKEVMVGVIDVATSEVESPEHVADVIKQAMRHVDLERLVPGTNCGMAPLSRPTAVGKLAALGAGARLVRKELGM